MTKNLPVMKPGNANLPIGGLHDANLEIGVPGRIATQ
jgi:hypothetical protein